MLPTGRDKLYWLIDLYTSGHHDIETFRVQFERTYNFEVEKSELSANEKTAFADLFGIVTAYSPFKEELEAIPFYKSTEQVLAAATNAKSVLGDFKIVATGTWLYDRVVPRSISVLRKPAELADSRYSWEADKWDKNIPIPETLDGFLYTCSLGKSGEHLTIEGAMAWADAQTWGPVVWD